MSCTAQQARLRVPGGKYGEGHAHPCSPHHSLQAALAIGGRGVDSEASGVTLGPQDSAASGSAVAGPGQGTPQTDSPLRPQQPQDHLSRALALLGSNSEACLGLNPHTQFWKIGESTHQHTAGRDLPIHIDHSHLLLEQLTCLSKGQNLCPYPKPVTPCNSEDTEYGSNFWGAGHQKLFRDSSSTEHTASPQTPSQHPWKRC